MTPLDNTYPILCENLLQEFSARGEVENGHGHVHRAVDVDQFKLSLLCWWYRIFLDLVISGQRPMPRRSVQRFSFAADSHYALQWGIVAGHTVSFGADSGGLAFSSEVASPSSDSALVG